MVDIPQIQRQVQETPISEGRYEANPQLPTNVVGETINQVAQAGVNFYERQLDTSANDYARDAYIQIRDEFNTQFNAGEGEKLGLRNIEGYEQFVEGRNRVTEKLNKKREELLSKDGLTGFARKKAEEKIDEAMSTFSYYMDVQEGQVKVADRTKKTALTIEAKQEDLNNFFVKGFNANDPKTVALVGGFFKDIRDTMYDSMVDSGTASKTVDENGQTKYNVSNLGQTKYNVSNLGQMEVQKVMSRVVGEFIENVASQEDGPAKAKVLLDNYGGYMLETTKNRVSKTVNQREKINNAYSIANELRLRDTPLTSEQLDEEISKRTEDPEMIKKIRSQYLLLRSQDKAADRYSDIKIRDHLLNVVATNDLVNMDQAEKFQDFLPTLNKIKDPKIKESVSRAFKPPPQSSQEAIEGIEALLARAPDFNNPEVQKEWRNHYIDLNFKSRKYYDKLRGLKNAEGVDIGNVNTYGEEIFKITNTTRFKNQEYYNKRNEVKLKVSEYLSKYPTLPKANSSEGLKIIKELSDDVINDEDLKTDILNFESTGPSFSLKDQQKLNLAIQTFRKANGGKPPNTNQLNQIKKNLNIKTGE